MVTNQQCRVSGTYNGGSLMKCLVINTMPWDALFSTKWVLLVCVLPSGRIPQGLFNSTPNLSEICLGSNRLTEAIHDSASSLLKLQVLVLEKKNSELHATFFVQYFPASSTICRTEQSLMSHSWKWELSPPYSASADPKTISTGPSL